MLNLAFFGCVDTFCCRQKHRGHKNIMCDSDYQLLMSSCRNLLKCQKVSIKDMRAALLERASSAALLERYNHKILIEKVRYRLNVNK